MVQLTRLATPFDCGKYNRGVSGLIPWLARKLRNSSEVNSPPWLVQSHSMRLPSLLSADALETLEVMKASLLRVRGLTQSTREWLWTKVTT